MNDAPITSLDCDTCPVRGRRCSDCVVSVIIGPTPELQVQEAEAIDLLARRGLIDPIRDPRVLSSRRAG